MSFFSEADVVDLSELSIAGVETLMTVFPGRVIELVLERENAETGEIDAVATQTVLLEYSERQENVIDTESGQEVTIEGWFTKIGAFDVLPGDAFTLGPAAGDQAGAIVTVRPIELGTQRASWRLALGS